MTDLEAIAAALLATPPAAFTAARDARAKAEPDRVLARSVAALRRPTVAAWAVDALVRDRPDEIESMLELAASLRDAQDDLDGPGLRELSSARRRLVVRLASEAVALAKDAEVRVSPAAREDVEVRVSPAAREDVERTLTAAMLDADAGAALASGRLVRALD